MNQELLKQKFSDIFYSNGYLRYYFSPGRINVIGEHIDYNGGLVFPCAISLGTYAVISLRKDSIVSLYSENFPKVGTVSFSLKDELEKDDLWTDYVKGVVSEIKKLGYEISQGFNAYIVGNLPNGASLSSSASLELLFGEIIRDLNDLLLDEKRIALLKPNAIVINVARGAVTDEAALAQAVEQGRIGGIGIDVYSKEPLAADHPYQKIRHLPNVCLTPHMAWGGYETRVRLMEEIAANIRAFLAGDSRNRVDL